MKIAEKITKRQYDQHGNPPVTIAFIGDSVTQGCFECDFKPEVGFFGPTEYRNGFANHLLNFLHLLCPTAQINLINAGIGGDSAPGGLARFDRDVGAFHPDLVVIGYALNDSGHGAAGLESYRNAMSALVEKTLALGAECIVLTPNAMNDRVSPSLDSEVMRNAAASFMQVDLCSYVDTAKAVAAEYGVPVCDVYAKWQSWRRAGVNVTELLSNKLNHPVRELHYLTAMLLAETIFEA